MSKTNNSKAFTLIELIIAMSIFTTVILIGYRLFDNYNLSVKNQSKTTEIQSAINNINKYITKDLETATGISLQCIEPNEGEVFSIENSDSTRGESYLQDSLNSIKNSNKIVSTANESKLTYRYTINSSQSPSYTVEMNYNKNNSYIEYTVYRTAQGDSRIEFITNSRIEKNGDTFETPFTITKNNPYKVTLLNEESKNKVKTYDFQVASRYVGEEIASNNTKPPVEIEYPDDIENPSEIGFWAADKSKCNEIVKSGKTEYENSLYTWIDGFGKFGNQDTRSQDNFNIKGDNDNGNSGKANSYIGYSTSSWNAEVKGQTIRAKEIEKIKIYVSPYTTLSEVSVQFKKNSGVFNSIIDLDNSITLTSNSEGKYTLPGNQNGTWYEVIFSKGSNDKANFDIEGKLNVNINEVESGYAVVFFGESKGNIVYEFTKTDVPNSQQIDVNGKREIFLPKKASESSDFIDVANVTIGTRGKDQTQNMDIIISPNQKQIRLDTIGNINVSRDSIQNVKKVRISTSGGLKITQINVFNQNITNLNNLPIELEVPQSANDPRITVHIKFSDMVDNVPGKFKIDLIY